MLKKEPLRVFLSYASKDRLTIRHLYNQLSQAEGIQPWFDETILMPGEEWEQEIATAVQSADVVAVCLSDNAVLKTGELNGDIAYALQEAGKRHDNQPHILVVKLHACEIPESLQHVQAVNWVEEKDYTKLVELLHTFPKTALPLSSAQVTMMDAPTDGPLRTDSRQQASHGHDNILLRASPTKQPLSDQVAASTSASPSARARQKSSGKDDEQWIQEVRRRAQDPKNKPAKAQPAAVVAAAPSEKQKSVPIIVAIVVALVAILAVVGILRGMTSSSTPAEQTQTSTGTDERELLPTVSPTMSTDDIVSPASTSERFAPGRILDPSGSMTPTLEPPARDESEPVPTVSGEQPTRTTMLPLSDTVTPSVDVRVPTNTPIPTDTPMPTDTPEPTEEPTEEPALNTTDEPQMYTIQPGDTIRAIADEYNVTVTELMELNDMSAEDADTIRPDQEILIPAPGE